MISVIPRKKVLIPRHSEFRGRDNSEARNGTERNGIPRKNEVLRNSHRTASMITLTLNTIIEILGCLSCFLFRWRIRKGILRVFFYFCIHGKEFRVVFSSAEVFGREFREFASIFVQRNGIPNCFLFRGRVRNGIPRFSVPRNSRNSVGNNHLFRLFRLPRNNFFVKFPTLLRIRLQHTEDPNWTLAFLHFWCKI